MTVFWVVVALVVACGAWLHGFWIGMRKGYDVSEKAAKQTLVEMFDASAKTIRSRAEAAFSREFVAKAFEQLGHVLRKQWGIE